MTTLAQAPARPKLSPYERECLIERAAIMEYDGNLPRAEAERLAWKDLDRQRHLAMIRGFQPVRSCVALKDKLKQR